MRWRGCRDRLAVLMALVALTVTERLVDLTTKPPPSPAVYSASTSTNSPRPPLASPG
jgi:hypothetical protein